MGKSTIFDVKNHWTCAIDAGEFRTALLAAIPHASIDDSSELWRVNVNVNVLVTVDATDGYTGIVVNGPDPVEWDGDVWDFSISPTDAAFVARFFKPGKDERITLRIDADDERVTFTDVGGLFDGQALTVVRMPETTRTSIAGLIGYHLSIDITNRGATAIAGDHWRRFSASAALYTGNLIVSPTSARGPLIVTSGRDFIGIMTARREIDDDLFEKQRDRWRDSLPVIQPPKPADTEAAAS